MRVQTNVQTRSCASRGRKYKVSRELLRTAELEPKTLHAETSRALLNRP